MTGGRGIKTRGDLKIIFNFVGLAVGTRILKTCGIKKKGEGDRFAGLRGV